VARSEWSGASLGKTGQAVASLAKSGNAQQVCDTFGTVRGKSGQIQEVVLLCPVLEHPAGHRQAKTNPGRSETTLVKYWLVRGETGHVRATCNKSGQVRECPSKSAARWGRSQASLGMPRQVCGTFGMVRGKSGQIWASCGNSALPSTETSSRS